MDFYLRQDLEIPLKSKASKLTEEKNEEGHSFQRCYYSKMFHKIDENTYQSMFTKDLVVQGKMRTERYLLTLKKSKKGWEVAQEELQDTYEKLIRVMPGDEKFYRFDSFRFDREGLKISSSSGSVVVDFLQGKPNSIGVTGVSLAYDYEPPLDLSFHHNQRYQHLKSEKEEDFVFEPEIVGIFCDEFTCQEFLDSLFAGLQETSVENLDPDLRKFYNKADKEQREARRGTPFTGFQLPLEPDRRNYTVAVKKQDHDHWLWLGYDNEDALEVSFGASGYFRLFGYPSAETRAAGIDPYEIEWREDAYSRLYDLKGLSGTVQIGRLEEADTVKGDIKFKMTIKKDLREIPFYLSNLRRGFSRRASNKKSSITVNLLQNEEGEDLTWIRRGPSSGIVIFPDTIPAGSEIVVRMDFESKGTVIKIFPSYSYVSRSGWLPFVRYEDRIEDFDLTVKTSARYKTLGVGKKVSEKKEGKSIITRWKAQYPVQFPTVIFGDYLEHEERDAVRKSNGSPIPITVHLDRDSRNTYGIRTSHLPPIAEQAVNAVNIYQQLYGVDFPYAKLDIVNDPGFWGAQAPASIIYVASGAFLSDQTLQEVSGDVSGWLVKMTDTLVAHEVAHQWWGSVFTNANNRNYWFIESLAEFSSALYREAVEGVKNQEKGRKAYLKHVKMWRDEILEHEMMASVQEAPVVWSGGSYRALVYSKGPYAFHILRESFGDEKFFAFLKDLGRELADRKIVTRDIQKVAEKSFGSQMEWFFDQWIRGVGVPEFAFFYDTRQNEDGTYLVKGKIRQRVVSGLKKHEMENVFFYGIVPVTVQGSGKNEYRVKLPIRGEETPFSFKVPEKPRNIEFNKYGEILSYPVLVNKDWRGSK